ncbi:sigma-70 family RNA polymerase sigma factor [Amycolatopsis sp. NPDC047767]|uniref:RNA polymerase sigma factor n=1 Tax=Amycolatopsis sp. NPDC047767 TaxID=3156765 RepID=UPI003452449E
MDVDLLRPLVPQVLGVLVRRYGQFEACEDAVQEALLAAVEQWADGDVPDNPRAWLLTVATRRLTDLWRSESARRRREENVAVQEVTQVAGPGEDRAPEHDDTLTLLFLCCHPAVTPSSQVALTLRAVGGLTTAEIATAFLVPEATMTRRITRAKESIAAAGSTFAEPSAEDWPARLQVVLHVLYLIFNEGYTASSGEELHRVELTAEAIRLTRAVHALLPDDGEVAGLLALMLLTDARRPARTHEGALLPLADQDRRLWTVPLIAEGLVLVNRTLGRGPVGPYQVQAAIAALHDRAASTETTDWPQIVELYDVLAELAPSPVVTLNRAIAVAMVDGPAAALNLLATVADDSRLKQGHRLDAVRAHLLELAGDTDAAHAHYLRAAKRTSSLPERRYLQSRAEKFLPVRR